MDISACLRSVTIGVIGSLLLVAASAISAKDGIDHRTITFWSEGSRLKGDIFKPQGLNSDEQLPGIILLHGWGGNKANLNRSYAAQFASLGFVVMTFDFRSWGQSEGYVVTHEALSTKVDTSEISVQGHHIRNVVNPLKMIEDARAALSWFVAEPNLQADNIGFWGTSLGGGLALVTAAQDSRVKALVTQIGAVNNKASFAQIPDSLVATWETQRARGQIAPYPGPESSVPGLRGNPDLIAMKRYDPAAYWDQISVPTLIIDAEDEELFDRRLNGKALHKALKDRVAAHYLVIPGKHYDIYRDDGYAKALEAAQDWFVTHLK